MDYNDALKFIKERTQELKEFLENNPGEQMPSLPGFEEEERVNFLDGGDYVRVYACQGQSNTTRDRKDILAFFASKLSPNFHPF